MDAMKLYFTQLWALVLDMAPWLLMGFFIAGLLHVAFPQGKINRLLGKSNVKSVLRAALIGIPLPLCSCGVIPTGVSIYRNGASRGASVSFLISTPQTGVDSIMVTYSLLGWPFAIIRPVVALVTGLLGGALVNKLEPVNQDEDSQRAMSSEPARKIERPVRELFRYAFVEFLQDIAKWLVIGLAIAALIAVFIPDDFFASYLHNDLLGMLVILAASIPVYVCATSSVPIAAVLMMKGLSPGAALIFLMAGPATNAATISVIGKSMGRKTLFSYLTALITGALLFGLLIDYFLPREWFLMAFHHVHGGHEHGLLPYWLQLASGITITLLLMNVFLQRWIRYNKVHTKAPQDEINTTMGAIKVYVRGMNCNHCKMSVENGLSKLDGIESITADLAQEMVTIQGNSVNLDQVKTTIESMGYTYDGEVK